MNYDNWTSSECDMVYQPMGIAPLVIPLITIGVSVGTTIAQAALQSKGTQEAKALQSVTESYRQQEAFLVSIEDQKTRDMALKLAGITTVAGITFFIIWKMK